MELLLCELSCRARRTVSGKARSQTQVAVSSDGESWFLLGASPDHDPRLKLRRSYIRVLERAARRLVAWFSPVPISTMFSACVAARIAAISGACCRICNQNFAQRKQHVSDAESSA